MNVNFPGFGTVWAFWTIFARDGGRARRHARVLPPQALALSGSTVLERVRFAIVAALTALTLAEAARQTAIVYLTTALAAVAGFTYILWSGPDLHPRHPSVLEGDSTRKRLFC